MSTPTSDPMVEGPGAAAPEVSVADLSIGYGSVRPRVVVEGVSFDVAAGSTLALVGESGSGKSTVAHALLGHLRPGARLLNGDVTVGGERVFDLDSGRLRAFRATTVALVPQNAGHALTPSMRVGDQISELPVLRGRTSDERRSELVEAFDSVGLSHSFLHRYPHQLSGGQQQRVAIAMALLARPRVLVLDEPTTGLDVVTQRAVLALLRGLTDSLRTATVVVSHDLGVVAAMADDVAVLQHGRMVEHQPASDLFRSPRSPHTRQLLASVPRLTGDHVRRRPVRAEVGGPPEPVVEVKDLVIGYGRRSAQPAVDGVSMLLRRGEILALVGESGSGKSTLAWSLAGLHRPTTGEMRLATADRPDDSGDLTRPAAQRPRNLRRRIQMVFQNADTALNPRQEVAAAIRRPIRFFGTNQGQPVDVVVQATADDVHLARELLTRLPAQLSGGQRQRVGIGRALAARPDVLVADEITTALDVSVQATILELLDDLRREHALACLFISHDLAVVRDIADSVAVLHRGRVVEQGPTATVFAGPNHPYTAELVQATLEPDPSLARQTVDQSGPGPLARTLAGGPSDTDGVPVPSGGWTHAEGMVDLGQGHRVRCWRPLAQGATPAGAAQ